MKEQFLNVITNPPMIVVLVGWYTTLGLVMTIPKILYDVWRVYSTKNTDTQTYIKWYWVFPTIVQVTKK